MKRIQRPVIAGVVIACFIFIFAPFVHAPSDNTFDASAFVSEKEVHKEEKEDSREDDEDGLRNEYITKKFIVTAYYAPLPDQTFYVTGSYLDDKVLNGKGVATYSGKIPEVGHIAADLSVLPLGTTLVIPGYGEGVVEDIGGRIKGNRLDVFMGYGEEGMVRALDWGKKILDVKIINEEA